MAAEEQWRLEENFPIHRNLELHLTRQIHGTMCMRSLIWKLEKQR